MNQLSKANGKTDRQRVAEPESLDYVLVKREKKKKKTLNSYY